MCDGGESCQCNASEEKAGYFRPVIPAGITEAGLVEHLRYLMPLSIDAEYHIDYDDRAALGIVDMVKGFCKPGCGPLAPPAPDPIMEATIGQVSGLATRFRHQGRSIMVWRDWHKAEFPEPPFPPHCIENSEEAEMIDELSWLEDWDGLVDGLVVKKGCINGWVGAESISTKGLLNNIILDNLRTKRIQIIVIAGVCTDICDMQLVHSLLSARNCGLLPDLKDVVVCTSGCATYDLPLNVVRAIDLPETAAHPREAAEHTGLYLMQQCGAILARNILL